MWYAEKEAEDMIRHRLTDGLGWLESDEKMEDAKKSFFGGNNVSELMGNLGENIANGNLATLTAVNKLRRRSGVKEADERRRLRRSSEGAKQQKPDGIASDVLISIVSGTVALIFLWLSIRLLEHAFANIFELRRAHENGDGSDDGRSAKKHIRHLKSYLANVDPADTPMSPDDNDTGNHSLSDEKSCEKFENNTRHATGLVDTPYTTSLRDCCNEDGIILDFVEPIPRKSPGSVPIWRRDTEEGRRELEDFVLRMEIKHQDPNATLEQYPDSTLPASEAIPAGNSSESNIVEDSRMGDSRMGDSLVEASLMDPSIMDSLVIEASPPKKELTEEDTRVINMLGLNLIPLSDFGTYESEDVESRLNHMETEKEIEEEMKKRAEVEMSSGGRMSNSMLDSDEKVDASTPAFVENYIQPQNTGSPSFLSRQSIASVEGSGDGEFATLLVAANTVARCEEEKKVDEQQEKIDIVQETVEVEETYSIDEFDIVETIDLTKKVDEVFKVEEEVEEEEVADENETAKAHEIKNVDEIKDVDEIAKVDGVNKINEVNERKKKDETELKDETEKVDVDDEDPWYNKFEIQPGSMPISPVNRNAPTTPSMEELKAKGYQWKFPTDADGNLMTHGTSRHPADWGDETYLRIRGLYDARAQAVHRQAHLSPARLPPEIKEPPKPQVDPLPGSRKLPDYIPWPYSDEEGENKKSLASAVGIAAPAATGTVAPAASSNTLATKTANSAAVHPFAAELQVDQRLTTPSASDQFTYPQPSAASNARCNAKNSASRPQTGSAPSFLTAGAVPELLSKLRGPYAFASLREQFTAKLLGNQSTSTQQTANQQTVNQATLNQQTANQQTSTQETLIQQQSTHAASQQPMPPNNSGMRSPGHMSPGTMSPGHISPGTMSPGTMSPGHMSPGTLSPGTMSPGSISSSEMSSKDVSSDNMSSGRMSSVRVSAERMSPEDVRAVFEANKEGFARFDRTSSSRTGSVGCEADRPIDPAAYAAYARQCIQLQNRQFKDNLRMVKMRTSSEHVGGNPLTGAIDPLTARKLARAPRPSNSPLSNHLPGRLVQAISLQSEYGPNDVVPALTPIPQIVQSSSAPLNVGPPPIQQTRRPTAYPYTEPSHWSPDRPCY